MGYDLADISPNLFGLSPLAVQQRHDEAFDVEPVTREFFSEYRRIFEEVEAATRELMLFLGSIPICPATAICPTTV